MQLMTDSDSTPIPIAVPSPDNMRRSRRKRWRAGCLWMLIGGVLAALAPVFLSGAAMMFYLMFPPASFNVVILGVDARAGEGFLTRTDSVIVMGVNPAGLDISLLSIPRDLFIEVPGYNWQRINTINVLGEQDSPGNGAALVQAAIAQSFNIEVQHYMRINFDGFTEIIDALGGVDIEVPSLLIDYEYPTANGGTTTIRFEPGWEHMDGQRALAYARTRHADDDYRRAERQQQVMAAITRAMLKPANWPRLPAAITAFLESVDTDMNVLDLLKLAPPLVLDGATGNMDRLVIDRSLIQYAPEGYAIPDYAALNAWIDEHLR